MKNQKKPLNRERVKTVGQWLQDKAFNRVTLQPEHKKFLGEEKTMGAMVIFLRMLGY